MSAAELREAAALMRSRAERAEASGDGEPWYPADELHGLIGAGSRNTADAEHIAALDPSVTVAVADWLEATARELDALGDPDLSGHPLDGRRTAALAVARTYLRSDR